MTLRPRALFGPGDTVIIPRLLRALEAQRLPILGDGDALIDMTYIDNAVDAVIAATDAPDSVLGRKYNITGGEPVRLWPFLAKLCTELDLAHPTRRVSYPVARAFALMLEIVHRTVRRGSEPLLTRYTAGLLATSMTLDISAARRDLGYVPAIDIEEGTRRFLEWWRSKS